MAPQCIECMAQTELQRQCGGGSCQGNMGGWNHRQKGLGIPYNRSNVDFIPLEKEATCLRRKSDKQDRGSGVSGRCQASTKTSPMEWRTDQSIERYRDTQVASVGCCACSLHRHVPTCKCRLHTVHWLGPTAPFGGLGCGRRRRKSTLRH